MRAYLLVAALIVSSGAARANEAFIPQSSTIKGIVQDATARAGAIAVPVTPAAFTATSAVPTANLSSNVSSITQQGTKNLATVSQTGGFNQSTIAQTGSGNQAVVTQRR